MQSAICNVMCQQQSNKACFCRLVEGTSLSDFIDNLRLTDNAEVFEHESVVMTLAAQLLQVLSLAKSACALPRF